MIIYYGTTVEVDQPGVYVKKYCMSFRQRADLDRMSDVEEDKPKVTITLRTIVTGPEAGSIIGRGGEVVKSIR